MSKSARPKEEIELGPCLPGGLRPFLRWRDGEVIQKGVGAVDHTPELGDTCLEFGPVQKNGRREIKRTFTINSSGSVCHSGASSREYRDGWDRIFAARKPCSQAN